MPTNSGQVFLKSGHEQIEDRMHELGIQPVYGHISSVVHAHHMPVRLSIHTFRHTSTHMRMQMAVDFYTHDMHANAHVNTQGYLPRRHDEELQPLPAVVRRWPSRPRARHVWHTRQYES